ncbi:glycoside hydrolase, partial [Streptomyces atacamensis]
MPVSELLTRMRDLYRRAEDAGEAHGAVEREVAERRGKVDRLQRELAGTRVRLAEARDETGRLARQHYRGASGVLPPSLRLLFGGDEREVRTVLEHGRAVERVLGDRAAAAARLVAEERRLDRLATRARGALDRQL